MSKSFEKSMEELDKIIAEIESDGISLDESITKFEEGMKLIKECRKALEDARQRVDKILSNGDVVPLDEKND